MVVSDGERDVKIQENFWPLAEPLFAKWGYDPDLQKINVHNIEEITTELSAWGIPWRHI